jgi:hypothetical protein
MLATISAAQIAIGEMSHLAGVTFGGPKLLEHAAGVAGQI